MSVIWNLWHGCLKVSAGCANCYMYRTDEKFGRDSRKIYKTQDFNLPMRKIRGGNDKIPAGSLVYTCFTSDFFIQEADLWREDAWGMMRYRQDLHFFLTTKRVERINECLPDDWGNGYENVTICCTVENQKEADRRLPIYLLLPLKHKTLICEPLLTPLDLSSYLTGEIEKVIVGGESGDNARPCRYDWVLAIRETCLAKNVAFTFKQTGANFIKDGKHYRIPRKIQQSQAKKAGIDVKSEKHTAF
ncbi:DUF5131 family protein [Necropsobacter rosorum]|uniref:DUF5131 family protein n=1 Tax=Necropsobacter rosorum TaxID=908285 RepID=UPI000509FDC0